MGSTGQIGDWSLRAAHPLGCEPTRKGRDRQGGLAEAQFFRTEIVEGLCSGVPSGQALQPLAPTTPGIRRFRGFKGSKPLVVHGDLLNWIAVVKQANGVFVGVLRTTKGNGGQSLANTAAVREFGSRACSLNPSSETHGGLSYASGCDWSGKPAHPLRPGRRRLARDRRGYELALSIALAAGIVAFLVIRSSPRRRRCFSIRLTTRSQ